METINTKSPNTLEILTAEELAIEAKGGSKAHFSELVNRYGPRLYHFLRHKVSRDEDAEDLVQNTLVKAYQNLHRYNPSHLFSAWIFTIGRREAISYYRAQQRRRERPEPAPPEAVPNPLEMIIHREEKDNLWKRARQLPEKQYDALWLRYAEDMSVKEIAKVLSLTQIHIKVLLYRGRSQLAKLHQQTEPTVQPAERYIMQNVECRRVEQKKKPQRLHR